MPWPAGSPTSTRFAWSTSRPTCRTAIDCRRLVATANERARPRRHPRQQRRRPARRADPGLPRRQVGPDHRDQPLLGLPHHRRRPAADARPGLGPHRQHRLRPRPDRLAVQVGLRRGQARRGRPDQGRRARDRRGADHLQRHLPRLRADPAGRGADPRHHEAVRHGPRDGDPRGPARAPALAHVRHRRADRRLRRLPLLARPPSRSPAPPSRSTAAGPRCEAGRQDRHQPRAPGRRRARRLHLGRPRPAPRRGRHRDRGHLRHLRRRDERRRAQARLGARRQRRRAGMARHLLAARLRPRRRLRRGDHGLAARRLALARLHRPHPRSQPRRSSPPRR